jgi:hypothetical protein
LPDHLVTMRRLNAGGQVLSDFGAVGVPTEPSPSFGKDNRVVLGDLHVHFSHRFCDDDTGTVYEKDRRVRVFLDALDQRGVEREQVSPQGSQLDHGEAFRWGYTRRCVGEYSGGWCPQTEDCAELESSGGLALKVDQFAEHRVAGGEDA